MGMESINCRVTFSVNNSIYNASYRIEEMSYNVFYAIYKLPFGSGGIEETSNVRWIHYDKEMLENYFVGEFRDTMSEVGEFDSREVYSIDQFGIDMSGNSAKAQVIIFYNEHKEVISKIAYPSYFPVKCNN